MSRDISALIQSAIEDADSVKMAVKAVIDPSRTFFSSLVSDYPYDAGDYSVPTDTPTGQVAGYDGYTDNVYTFVVDPSTGSIYGMVKGSATKNNLSLTADADSKPGLKLLGNGSAYLYYWDGSNLKRSTVNLSTWGVTGTTTITIDFVPAAWSISAGSPIVLSGGQLAFFYQTSIGGIAVAYYDNAYWHHWEGRFLSPNQKTSKDWTIYTAAAIIDEKIFFYMTDMDTGEVKGVEYIPTRDIWSASFVALPADLSRFNVGNAITANGFVHLSGQFHRTGDLANAAVYSLVLRSVNGRTFSWDRFTLLSDLGFTFQIAADNSNGIIWASDRNSVGFANMSYFFHLNPPDRITLQPPNDIVGFSLTSNNDATLVVRAGDDTYIANDLVRKGNKVTIYIGYEVGSSFEYIQFAQYIIQSTNKLFSESERSFVLNLIDEGLWKTNEIAFPFYAELLSKSSSHDDCDERDKMYPVNTKHPDSPDFLYIDFWGNNEWDGDSSPTGVSFKFRASGQACHWKEVYNYQGATDQLMIKTVALNEHPFLTEYPVLESTSLAVSLYGWEMTSNSLRPNSTWSIYAVTAPADDLNDKTVTQGTLSSTYAKFPREKVAIAAGSLPITWNITGLTAGDVLLYFGFTISNTSTSGYYSRINPGRLIVTGLVFDYDSDLSSRGWALSLPSTETREYLEMPKSGLPSVMFLTKPYTAYNFNVRAEFIYSAGDTPLIYGDVGWGVVGMAADGKNLILARYNKLTSYVELVYLRDGEETRVATYTPATQPKDIMLQHRDGLYQVFIRESGTAWAGPVISYWWDEVTHDVMSTSSTGIMHVGIYGTATAPYFFTPGFNPNEGNGIGILPTHNASTLSAFPSSGNILIDGVRYAYASKVVGSSLYGPYQARQSESYSRLTIDGNNYPSGWATEIALYKPRLDSDTVAGLLLCSDNAHSWVITESWWDVFHTTGGIPNYLPNRSRHYVTNHSGDVVGVNNRMYILSGLLDITQESDNIAYTHSFGSRVSLYGTDQIWVKKVIGTTLDADMTIKDMLSYICNVASVEAEFNGDWTSDSQVVGTTPVQLASQEELFPGGFDVTFTIPPLSDTHWIEIYASNLLYNTTETIHLGIKNTSGILHVYANPSGSSPSESIPTGFVSSKSRTCRILFHDEFASIYLDGRAVAIFSFGTANLEWPQTQVTLYIKASTNSYTVSGLRVTELFDWREAIYMESELTASSAIGSVIQERPIEILTDSNGNLTFSYNIVRDTVSISSAISRRVLHRHSVRDTNSKDAGSDAIVYYKDIGFVSDPLFAQTDGFITRVLKLASLDTGADVAARLILEKSRERSKLHDIEVRPDVRLVPGDRYEFAYWHRDDIHAYAIIVESLSIEFREGEYVMRLSGRESSTQNKISIKHAYLEGTT